MSPEPPRPPLDLQAICDRSGLHRALHLTVDRAGQGVRLTARLDLSWANDDTGRVVHGGAIAALLDSALTFALLAAGGDDWTTADLRVDYLRPVAVGRVELAAEVLRAGRTLGRARATLLGGDGRPSAVAIGSCVRLGPLSGGPVRAPAAGPRRPGGAG